MIYLVSKKIIDETFNYFRNCGVGRRECQVVWTSKWASPEIIEEAVHPVHRAHVGGFVLDDSWINSFWLQMARSGSGIRFQIHTHPAEAFHSPTDDEYPIVHVPGFLSLVIPNFGFGSADFVGAFLTEIGSDGHWHEVSINSRIRVIHE